LRKELLHGDDGPTELTGDGLAHLRDLRDQLLQLADALINPYVFQPHGGISGAPGLPSSGDGPTAPASGNTLAQLSATTATMQVGNPLTPTRPLTISVPITVDLRTRRISLPADWTVSVSPAQVINLAPGAVVTATVAIQPGSPLPQGSVPQVYVEGYDHADNRLLGGVVVEVKVPNYVFFDGFLHVYLPLTRH